MITFFRFYANYSVRIVALLLIVSAIIVVSALLAPGAAIPSPTS